MGESDQLLGSSVQVSISSVQVQGARNHSSAAATRAKGLMHQVVLSAAMCVMGR